MAIEYTSLPVYEQKQRILDTLKDNQVVIVESPTGSGKTTQIPVILYEAGYANSGMIAVTQPRRIAAISVSEFISKQLGTTYPGLVGYKMRFIDKTDSSTRIKIMTDGILLQEMKLDPWLSKYSVIMVDEAHERSLNIDFVLGLLKRVLKERSDFRVIVSSATMNTQAFSEYFDNAPIVSIDTITFPVAIVYDPPTVACSTSSENASEALLSKICQTIDRVLDNDEEGGILIFLPGEKIIKDCVDRLYHSPFGKKLHILPLYGRLPKEEQERVFDDPPEGKKKVVISTNIAETSVTIRDITTVIDCGLAKLNFYNPHLFTSSLIETPVSKASCNQRKGRAGRTQEGTCYRLYTRKDFEQRPVYSTEEIYRTDLSEVVLRMSELGITDFFNFDFISKPGKEGIIGAVDTLHMLGALDDDNTLSAIGKIMVKFPLEPRTSRIIVEAITRFPDSIDKALTAASFLSANSPFVLPPNEEMEARKAHHRFQDIQGDFVAYLNILKAYKNSDNREKFCKKNYLDERVMAEIDNIYYQLSQIVSDMNIPILEDKGSIGDYLCCIASGMIQFVCIRVGKDKYKSLTADHICIHPGSVMFRQDPVFIVAGEIVRTSRIFAMSVSPLTRPLLDKINPELYKNLISKKSDRKQGEIAKSDKIKNPKNTNTTKKAEDFIDNSKTKTEKIPDESVYFGGEIFETKKIKGKKTAILPINKFLKAVQIEKDEKKLTALTTLKGKITTRDNGSILDGEKMGLILKVAQNIDITPVPEKSWNRKMNVNINNQIDKEKLIDSLDFILKTTIAKQKQHEYGFITLFTDTKGTYWFKVSRGFSTALSESHSSLETLVDENIDFSVEEKNKINYVLRKVNQFYS
jgi:ATP-dependent helicase HrpA